MSQPVTSVDGLMLLLALVAVGLVPGDWQDRIANRLGDRIGLLFVFMGLSIILLLPVLIPVMFFLEANSGIREFMRELTVINRSEQARSTEHGFGEETTKSKRRMLQHAKSAAFFLVVGPICVVLAAIFFTKHGYTLSSRAVVLYLGIVGIGVFRGVRFYVDPLPVGEDDQLIG